MTNQLDSLVSLGGVLVLFLLAAVVAFFWIFLPFFILSALKKQLAVQEKILRALDRPTIQTSSAPEQFHDPAPEAAPLEYPPESVPAE